jgi:signal transduction histidine kinase
MHHKILVIDDEQDFADNLADILEDAGFEVQKAYSGQNALEIAPEFKPDLILSDISMPQMDGYQLFEEMKKNEITFNTPFVFLSGMGDPIALRKGMDLGADDYLPKMLDAPKIIKSIEVRLNKHKKETGFYEKNLLNIKKVVATTLPHELRSPLNSILGFAQLIRTRYDEFSREEINSMLGDIENSGYKLLHLINNYNFYNRLVNNPETIKESGTSNTVYSSIILDSVPYEIAANYQRVENLTLKIENAVIDITSECFKKLVEELCDNSFKFSRPNTEVIVETSIEDDYYVISFIDDGIEITEDQFVKIGVFEQFDRNKNEQQGTGMGLAIVSKIVEIWNGKLGMLTEEGGRTTFKAYLPLSSNQNLI